MGNGYGDISILSVILIGVMIFVSLYQNHLLNPPTLEEP